MKARATNGHSADNGTSTSIGISVGTTMVGATTNGPTVPRVQEDRGDHDASGDSPTTSVWTRDISKRWLVVPAVLLVLLLIATGDRVPSTRLRIAVGPAFPVEFKQPVPDARYLPDRWLFTTAEVERLSFTESIVSGLRGETTEYSPNSAEQDEQSKVKSLVDMAVSKKTAFYVATQVRGGTAQPLAVIVSSVEPNSPAAAAGLQAGEAIREINGVPVNQAQDVVDAIRASGGGEITLTVIGSSGQRQVAAVAQPDEERGWKLGVSLTSGTPDSTPTWEIDSAEVGGPSAGLMFTLSYVDAAGEGDLSGGRKIAGTGTIESDGSVGAVGAVPLKVQGAERAGAEVFLVPEREAAEARGAATTVQVVPVGNIAEAVDWLCSNGGQDAICQAI